MRGTMGRKMNAEPEWLLIMDTIGPIRASRWPVCDVSSLLGGTVF